MGRPSRIALPRGGLLFLSILAFAILGSTYLWSNAPPPSKLVSTIFSNNRLPTEHPITSDDSIESDTITPNTESTKTPATAESEKGSLDLGKHYNVRPSASNSSARIEGCEYPILIHVTPDIHCTGALTVYSSIVRNVLSQPKALRNKVCVHVTYIDQNLTSIENMYQWKARQNPYPHMEDCAALDSSPELNKIVPVRFQALSPIERPEFMESQTLWLAALNKVHSWGFDLYPRILILDADSIILTDLHKIFESTPAATIVGAADQFQGCHDRSRINGGMILLKPSRYFHISVAELLYDKQASCFSGNWGQSEQELLNCVCGYTYDGYKPLRPEFQCSILPLYNSVWPRNYGCSGANVVPIRSVHFTPVKPWRIDENDLDSRVDTRYWKCIRDAGRSKSVEKLTTCRAATLAETRQLPELAEKKRERRRS
ncbi:hypothetical protein QQS21_006898 [Conoideocrella luteorostrata]|uniref:Glycosyltransferase family 8 protein n=1 Tax=Conoideocrella luteorostrata TaxID=1105319 RepID=A0AAJ0FSZ6_9HYPO|nr:hypothetical protein QQS21_006898 [Conoideocrella luteorostrata]